MNYFVSYTISHQDLIKSWTNDICPEDNLLVIYDPLSHYEYLKSKGLDMDDLHIYESKLMIVHFALLEDAIEVMNSISFTEGPLCEFWSKGRYITDNSVSCDFVEK